MKGLLYYWRCWLRDCARYSPAVGRLTAAGLSLAARAAGSPLRRLALLTRAARLRPTPAYLASLRPRLEAELDRLEQGGVDWDALAGPARSDLPKALIVKPPVSPREKGLLYVTFEDHFLRLLRSGQGPAIAERYDLLLGPSCSPPPDIELLLMARLWPGRLFTLLSNFADAELMRAVSPRLLPVPLLASSWIDPDDFATHLG